MSDSRFVLDSRFDDEADVGSLKGASGRPLDAPPNGSLHDEVEDVPAEVEDVLEDGDAEGESEDGFGDGMVGEGFSGPAEKVVKPLTPEGLARYKAAQEKTGVVYISRIPPGMRPTKVRHLMSQYGKIGRVYLQPEGMSAPLPRP